MEATCAQKSPPRCPNQGSNQKHLQTMAVCQTLKITPREKKTAFSESVLSTNARWQMSCHLASDCVAMQVLMNLLYVEQRKAPNQTAIIQQLLPWSQLVPKSVLCSAETRDRTRDL